MFFLAAPSYLGCLGRCTFHLWLSRQPEAPSPQLFSPHKAWKGTSSLEKKINHKKVLGQQKGITQVVNLSGSGRAKKHFTHRGRGLVENFHGTIFTFQLPLAIVLCIFKIRNVHRCNAPQKKKARRL